MLPLLTSLSPQTFPFHFLSFLSIADKYTQSLSFCFLREKIIFMQRTVSQAAVGVRTSCIKVRIAMTSVIPKLNRHQVM